MSKEENRTEKTLTTSERELRLLEEIPMLVWRARPEGNIEYVNKRVLDYFGAPLSEVIGWAWMEKVHPDDVAFKVRTWLQNLESGNPNDVVCRFLGADGGYRWFEVRGEPSRASDGAVLSWYGVLIDIDDRKRAEEALRDSEYKLRQIIETVPSLLWSLGPSGEQTQLNHRALDYIGVRFEELLDLGGWTKFIHPDDLPETANAFHHSIQTGTSYQAVHRIRRADGEYRWHHARGEPLRDSEGRVIQWYGLSVDIDEAKRAGEQPGSAAQLQANLNVLPAYTWYAAPRGALTFVNKRTADYLGVAKDHPLRFGIDVGAEWDHSFALLHPDDREDARKYWSSRLSTGQGGEHSYRVRSSQGDYRWFLTRMEPLQASDGTLLLWLGATLDIEELKCAEQALRRSEAYLTEAQRLSHTGSFGWTPSTGELHWSDETFRILDYDPSIKPTIERVLKRIHPDDVAMMRHLLDETSRGEKDFDVTHRLLMPDGSVKFVHVLSRVVKDAAGNLEIVGAVMDVTENTRLYRDLTEREARLLERTAELHRSEGYLAEAQRLSHTGTLVLNATTWQWVYLSDESYRILGFDPLQGLPSHETIRQRIHPDDRDRVWPKVQEALRQKKDYSGEFRIVLPDRTVKYLAFAAHHLFSTNGELVEVIATSVDVTDYKRAEEALRESEYKLRQIIEAVPGLVWSTDPDGDATYVNQRLLDYTGTPLGDFKNRKWERFLHPDDMPQFVNDIDQAIQTGTSFESVHRLRRSNGEYRWHHGRIEPLRDREGRIVQWYGLSVDIDEGKKAEDRLRRSEAHLAEAQRLSHTGSSVYSETAILYWSEEAFRIWGFDPREGLPSREAMLQRIHADDRDRHHQEIEGALREKRDCSIEFRILLPDGTLKDVEKIYHPVFSPSGELVEILASGIDVTERKLAEEEHERLRQLELDLAHMNRLSIMGELAASLAHEITQPIAAARNNARAALNFLDQQPPDLGEVGEALGCVVGDADRAGLIVDRIRDHIRKAPPRKHRFDLNEAIKEVIVLARSAIAENGVSVQTRLSDGLTPVEGDRVQLQQVILNLVLNAAEAMSTVDREARQLLISTEEGGANDVLVAVRDSGPGINPEHIERVFDAFYTTKPSGVGMGLSICRSIIEAHSGRLWADANELGGAAFQFTLPGAEGLMNSRHVVHQSGAPHEDSA